MTTEKNRAIVLEACKYLNDRNLPALFDLIHEEGSWSVPYRQDRFQFGGYRDKQAVCAQLQGFLSMLTAFSFEVQNSTAEDDRVVVEAASRGTGPAGAQYINNYIFIFFIKDGKLHTVREYFDPYQVMAYVEQLPPQA